VVVVLYAAFLLLRAAARPEPAAGEAEASVTA
jgi:hypothetical protein